MDNKEKLLSARVTEEEHELFCELAKKEDRTISNYLRLVIKDWIKNHKDEI